MMATSLASPAVSGPMVFELVVVEPVASATPPRRPTRAARAPSCSRAKDGCFARTFGTPRHLRKTTGRPVVVGAARGAAHRRRCCRRLRAGGADRNGSMSDDGRCAGLRAGVSPFGEEGLMTNRDLHAAGDRRQRHGRRCGRLRAADQAIDGVDRAVSVLVLVRRAVRRWCGGLLRVGLRRERRDDRAARRIGLPQDVFVVDVPKRQREPRAQPRMRPEPAHRLRHAFATGGTAPPA